MSTMIRIRSFILLLLPMILSSLLLGPDLSGASEPTPSAGSSPPSFRFVPRIHHLRNGLTLLTVDDPYSPTLTFQVWYRVGSRNEVKGRTGISHFNEHMMFTGTKKFPHGALDKLISEIGGQNNAFTDYDFTAYFENVAPDKLPERTWASTTRAMASRLLKLGAWKAIMVIGSIAGFRTTVMRK